MQGFEEGDGQGDEYDSAGEEVLPRKLGRREADLAARRLKYAAMRVAEAKAREEAAKERLQQMKVCRILSSVVAVVICAAVRDLQACKLWWQSRY